MTIVKKNKISILVLAWNGYNETYKTLEALFLNTTVPFELILIDNGSTDGTEKLFDEIVEGKFTNQFCLNRKVIHNKENLGVSKGYNVGLKEISDDSNYISIFSNDWIISQNWAEKLIECCESEPMCGFATACSNCSAPSMVHSSKNPNPLKPISIDWNDPLLFKKVDELNEYLGRVNDKYYTLNEFVCIGWMMKREVFDKVGLMDEEILSANDVSYTYLAAKYGYFSKTAWNVYIQHFFRASGKQIGDRELALRDQKDWHRIRNHQLYTGKEE